jgi:hypothetical protein
MAEMAGLEIDMAWVTGVLLEEGVTSFVNSFDELIADLEQKRAGLLRAA